MTTIPEAPETIEAQLEWLRAGKRKAVLLTPGCVVPELPAELLAAIVPEGLLLYREIDNWQVSLVKAGHRPLADLLGYGIDAKPDVSPPSPLNGERAGVRGEAGGEAPKVVVIRAANGHEKQAVVTDSKRLDAVTEAAHQVKDAGDTVHVEGPHQVIADRLKSLDGRDLKVRPLFEEDLPKLIAAAAADQHGTLKVTHIIERGGQIVGYFGVNSLPLYRLWFHSKELKASDSLRLLFLIENHYRMNGHEVVATVINLNSPFYAVAARGGYLEQSGDRLFLKEL